MASDDRDRSDGSDDSVDRRFWNELYWFSVLTMGAWIVALLVIPPRAATTLSLLELERDLTEELRRSEASERLHEKAIESIESDPYFGEALLRVRLGWARPNEERLAFPNRQSSWTSRSGN